MKVDRLKAIILELITGNYIRHLPGEQIAVAETGSSTGREAIKRDSGGDNSSSIVIIAVGRVLNEFDDDGTAKPHPFRDLRGRTTATSRNTAFAGCGMTAFRHMKSEQKVGEGNTKPPQPLRARTFGEDSFCYTLVTIPE